MFDRVLILSASAGAGHIRAAQAIEKAFAITGAAREVRHEDALKYTSPVIRRLYSQGYIDMVNHAPTLLGILYDNADKPWKDEEHRLAFDRLNTRPLAKMLREYKPDLVVCTHFLPAEIISWLICKKKIWTRHAVVVTDFDMHAMWLCRHYDDYFVAIDETREHLNALGVPRDRVDVSGIPIDPAFAQKKSKQEMRAKYDLNQELPTILMSAGGYGVGPVEEMLLSLQKMQHPAQVLALCGRNEELKTRLKELSHRESKVIIKPVAFTDKIDEYMAASDLLLGKPGGLTTSEALAKELAFVVVNPIPGQEERNSDHLLEEGIAIRCNNLPTLAFKIDKLLDDPKRLAAMHENARRLSHPNSAVEIVQKLLATDRIHTINVSGEHACETPLLNFVKTPARARRTLTNAKRNSRVMSGRIVQKFFRREQVN